MEKDSKNMIKKEEASATYSAGEGDEKAMEASAERWLMVMCKSGRAEWESNAERVADFLQKEGNEKLGLDIPIDIDHIKEQLLITDAEIMRKSKLLFPSSSGEGSGRRVLFIRRQLHKSDIDEHQNRLSMPCNQVNEAVLTAEEVGRLREGEKMAMEVVDPEGRSYEVNLRWSKAGKTSSSYAIGKPWNDIKRDNGFREGMVLEVWALRGEMAQLSFHLTRHT